jgi:hypothetical protein
MASRPSNFAELIEAVLEERAERVSFSTDEIEAEHAKFRARADRLLAAQAAKQRVADAIESLPAGRRQGWLEGVQSAVKLVLGEAARSSRILTDAARDLLPAAPGNWAFAPASAGGLRPAFELMAAPASLEAARAESLDEAASVARSLVIDDRAGKPMLSATIRNFPSDKLPPVLLIVAERGDAAGGQTLEVDPQITIEGSDEQGRYLRYEAVLPSGAYYAFFGNPRIPGR